MSLYSTNALLPTQRSLLRPKTFFLNTVYRTYRVEETQEVHIDVERGHRKAAVFVSPTSKGTPTETAGYDTMTFTPAYVKPKSQIRPAQAIARAIGERIGGGDMNPAMRSALAVAKTLGDQAARITRAVEGMATDALLAGKILVSGEGYAPRIVDFGRHPDLSIVLTGNDRWGQSNGKPLKSIQDAALAVAKIEGANITAIVMDVDAWAVLSADPEFQKLLDLRRGGTSTAELGPLNGGGESGAVQVAQTANFAFYVYSEWKTVQDVNGNFVDEPVLPSGTVIGISPQIEGERLFGAIMDIEAIEAGETQNEMFPKSWVEKETGQRWIMTQSAPMPVPKRPNASFSMRVL